MMFYKKHQKYVNQLYTTDCEDTLFPITSPLSPKQPISHHITLLSKCSAWSAKSKPWCHLVTLIIQCFGCQLSLGCCMAYDLRHILQTEPSSEHGNCYSLQGLHSKYWIRACFVSLAMFSNITQQKLIWLSLDQSNLYSGQDSSYNCLGGRKKLTVSQQLFWKLE